MRPVLVVVAAFLFAVVPASAADVDPQALVLGQADVPAGFKLDRDGSGLRTNESEARGNRRLPGLLRRWGRVTGYETEYDRREATLTSRADVVIWRHQKVFAGLVAFGIEKGRMLALARAQQGRIAAALR